jgi:F420-dependent oxidoreductase-like protein
VGRVKIGIAANVTGPQDAAFVRDAERLGVASVWVAEAWGQDALTPLAYLAAHTERIELGSAIAQLGARTPANLAMSAMSLQLLSGGRLRLGIGTSGPQVMEGWHGVRFTRPLAATRETIEIIRTVTSGQRLSHDGEVFRLPLPDGPGRPLRSMLAPAAVPIYVAALGPRNLELTGELADGWIGNAFMPEHAEVFLDRIAAGAARAGRQIGDLDLVIPVAAEITDDADAAARRHARGYAFTIGAMGSRDQNFYNAAFTRQGFGDEVRVVQDLWLAGRREEAADQVPLALGRQTNLLGPPTIIRERLRQYRDAGITTLQVKLTGDATERLDTLSQLLSLAAEIDAEPTGQPHPLANPLDAPAGTTSPGGIRD